MLKKSLAVLASVLMGVVLLSVIGAMWEDMVTPRNVYEWILGFAGSGILLMAAFVLPVCFYRAIME